VRVLIALFLALLSAPRMDKISACEWTPKGATGPEDTRQEVNGLPKPTAGLEDLVKVARAGSSRLVRERE